MKTNSKTTEDRVTTDEQSAMTADEITEANRQLTAAIRSNPNYRAIKAARRRRLEREAWTGRLF